MEIVYNADGTVEVDVPFTYTMAGKTTMRFDSIEDMKLKLKDPIVVQEMILGEDDFYVDGSFEIDHDCLEQMIEKLQGDV